MSMSCFAYLIQISLIVDDVINLAEINSEVPVEIYTGISTLTGTAVLVIIVLTFWNYLMECIPVLLDVGDAVHVEDGHEKIFILLQ